MTDLEARAQIVDLLTSYSRAVDTKDWDLYKSIFSADATIDYTSSGGIRGTPDEAVAWLKEVLAPFTMTQHLVTNHHIVVSGDEATCRSDYFNPMGSPDDQGKLRVFWVGGLYLDRFRRERDWRITERVEEMLWIKSARS